MELEKILARIAELNKRNAAIGAQVSGENASKLSTEELRALNTEQDAIIEEINKLQLRAIQLRATAQPIGNPVAAPSEEQNTELKDLSFRQQVGFVFARQYRKLPITKAEKRQLGKALTTTDSIYVEASAAADGVNNAGVFITTKVLLDLLREEKKLSPILGDIAFTSVAGLINFPYRIKRDKARFKHEGDEGLENQTQWGTLNGKTGYLQTIFPVSDEALALNDVRFGEYLIDQLFQDLGDDFAEQLIYADGQGDAFKGLLLDPIKAFNNGYEGDVTAAVVEGIKKCKGQYRHGAKLYVAQDVYDDIFFSVDELGRFKYPVLNNPQGISTVGKIPVEVDENLRPGDWIVGNVTKYFKCNSLIPARIEPERQAGRGVTRWVLSQYCATCPVPGAFVYGFKKA